MTDFVRFAIRRSRGASLPLSISVVLGALGCQYSSAREEQAQRYDSAGVQIVRSKSPDRPLNWRLREVFRLGGANAGPESFYKIDRRGVSVGPNGHLYVLDRGNHRVLSFLPNGEFLHGFGRKGLGPGELGVPVAISVASDGTVSILDYRKRGLTRFRPDGSALESQRLDLPYSGDYMVHTSEGLLMEIREGYRADGSLVYDKVALLRANGSTVDIASLARERPVTVQYQGCVHVALEPLFAPKLHWDANDDRLVVNATSGYEVDVYRDSRKVASYRRHLPLQRIERKDALAELGEGKTVTTPRGKCRINPEDELDGRGFADELPAIGGLALSPDGTIWVQRRALRGEPRLIDILHRDGRYLGTLPPGSPFPIAFLSAGRLIAEHTDELDIEYLVAYSIESET